MNQDSAPSPAAGDAPSPDDASALPRPVWAAVIGTLSVALAGLLLYRYLVQLAQLIGYGQWAHVKGKMGLLALLVTDLVLAWILLMAGIALLRRKPEAKLHLAYAVLKLVWFGFYMWHTVSSVGPVVGVMRFASQIFGEQVAPGPGAGALYTFTVLLALPEAVYPAFVAYWFSRAKVRRQIASWDTAPRPEIAGE